MSLLTPESISTICSLLGSILLAIGFFISNDQAIELGVSRWCSDKREENLKLPAIRDRIRQRNFGIAGCILLITGAIIGIIW